MTKEKNLTTEPMTPALTRDTFREGRRLLDAVKHSPLPSGKLRASYELHGIGVEEIIEPNRKPKAVEGEGK